MYFRMLFFNWIGLRMRLLIRCVCVCEISFFLCLGFVVVFLICMVRFCWCVVLMMWCMSLVEKVVVRFGSVMVMMLEWFLCRFWVLRLGMKLSCVIVDLILVCVFLLIGMVLVIMFEIVFGEILVSVVIFFIVVWGGGVVVIWLV